MFDPDTNKVVHSRDVVFEDSTPFFAPTPPPEVDLKEQGKLEEDIQKALEEHDLTASSGVPEEADSSEDESDLDDAAAAPIMPEAAPLLPEDDGRARERRRRSTKAEMVARTMSALEGRVRRSGRLGNDRPQLALVIQEMNDAANASTGHLPFDDHPMPRNFQEAMSRPDAEKWKEATDKEVSGIHKNETYDLVGPKELRPRPTYLATRGCSKSSPADFIAHGCVSVETGKLKEWTSSRSSLQRRGYSLSARCFIWERPSTSIWNKWTSSPRL